MNKTIWVIDDDEGILEVIQLFFKLEKFDGEFINKPLTIPAMLETRKNPALIFLDIYMTGIDGIELSKKIKNEAATKNIPIILMSADVQIAQKTIEAGADGYLQKPFDTQEMIDIINSHIK